jgi:hypothetical protein
MLRAIIQKQVYMHAQAMHIDFYRKHEKYSLKDLHINVSDDLI